jgi:hypothetical protein
VTKRKSTHNKNKKNLGLPFVIKITKPCVIKYAMRDVEVKYAMRYAKYVIIENIMSVFVIRSGLWLLNIVNSAAHRIAIIMK